MLFVFVLLVNNYIQTYPQVFRFVYTILQRFQASEEHTDAMSIFIVKLLNQDVEEPCQLRAYATRVDELQKKKLLPIFKMPMRFISI